MQNAEVIITLITSIVILLGTLAGTIISLISAIRGKKIVVNEQNVMNYLTKVIAEAETFSTLRGEEKKTYVLAKMQAFTRNNGFDFNLDAVSKAIDNIVAFTKQVNAK